MICLEHVFYFTISRKFSFSICSLCQDQIKQHKKVSIRLHLGVHKGIEWNDHKRMERNGMYLSKGNEWKRMKLSNLDWMF